MEEVERDAAVCGVIFIEESKEQRRIKYSFQAH